MILLFQFIKKKKSLKEFILSDESELQLDLTYMYIDSS